MRSANDAVNRIKNENKSADVEAMFIDLTSLKTVENFANSYITRNMYALRYHSVHFICSANPRHSKFFLLDRGSRIFSLFMSGTEKIP